MRYVLADLPSVRAPGRSAIWAAGNGAIVLAGVAVHAVSAEGDAAAPPVIAGLMADPAAVALSLSMPLVFVAGELYRHASTAPAKSGAQLRLADALSAVAAVGLTIAAANVGGTHLAVVAGAVLASAAAAAALVGRGQQDAPFGWLIVAGRVLMAVALVLALSRPGGDATAAATATLWALTLSTLFLLQTDVWTLAGRRRTVRPAAGRTVAAAAWAWRSAQAPGLARVLVTRVLGIAEP